ncbi:MAG: heavy metal-binding domain-containing protein [Pseudomonadota bacterium]
MGEFTLLVNIGLPLTVLVIAYLTGSYLERRHFADIRKREARMQRFPTTTFETLPDDWEVADCELMAESVVVSLDYFKRIIAGLRAIIGGRITTYEPLLDRARREAVLRVTEKAKAEGFDAVINLRLETSRLANSDSGQGIGGVEILAFGTALLRTQR